MHNLFMADHAGRLHYRIALLVHPKHRTLAEDALRCCAYDLHLWLRERQTRPADGNPALLLLEANFDAPPGAATQIMQKLRAYSDVFPITLIRLDLLDASLSKLRADATHNTPAEKEDTCIEIAWQRGGYSRT